VWIKGNLGHHAQNLKTTISMKSENVMVVRKMLDTLKAALMEEKQIEMALRASETVLQLRSGRSLRNPRPRADLRAVGMQPYRGVRS
jgi:regulator of sirC expression with transglutaminase-like and TPR domain